MMELSNGGHYCGTVATVFLINVLHDLFPPLMLKVYINIGRLVPG